MDSYHLLEDYPMPLAYVIDPERRMVETTGSGVVTGPETLDHQSRLKEDPAFRPDYCQLVDLTAVTSMKIDTQTIRQLASRNIFNLESRRAAVAKDALAVGMMRMISTYAEISGQYKEFRIFRDRDEALRWLLEP